MEKAMQQTIPSAPRLTCTGHLRQNIEHYLQDNIGVQQAIRNVIIESILANSDDIIAFDYRLELTKKFMMTPHQHFIYYF